MFVSRTTRIIVRVGNMMDRLIEGRVDLFLADFSSGGVLATLAADFGSPVEGPSASLLIWLDPHVDDLDEKPLIIAEFPADDALECAALVGLDVFD